MWRRCSPGEGGTWGYDSDAYAYWLKRMGDKAARIAARPARFAANVKIPVMRIPVKTTSS